MTTATTAQKQVFNRLISESLSFEVSPVGNASEFHSEGDLAQSLAELGFFRDMRKDPFQGDVVGANLWWNEEVQLLVSYYGKNWTIATVDGPL